MHLVVSNGGKHDTADGGMKVRWAMQMRVAETSVGSLRPIGRARDWVVEKRQVDCRVERKAVLAGGYGLRKFDAILRALEEDPVDLGMGIESVNHIWLRSGKGVRFFAMIAIGAGTKSRRGQPSKSSLASLKPSPVTRQSDRLSLSRFDF